MMSGWKDAPQELLEYLPKRRLRRDESGTLAFAGFYASEWNDDKMLSGGVNYTRARLEEELSNIESPLELAASLFHGDLGRFLVVVEGAWVLLFLLAKSGLSRDEFCGVAFEFLSDSKSSALSGRLPTCEALIKFLEWYERI